MSTNQPAEQGSNSQRPNPRISGNTGKPAPNSPSSPNKQDKQPVEEVAYPTEEACCPTTGKAATAAGNAATVEGGTCQSNESDGQSPEGELSQVDCPLQSFWNTTDVFSAPPVDSASEQQDTSILSLPPDPGKELQRKVALEWEHALADQLEDSEDWEPPQLDEMIEELMEIMEEYSLDDDGLANMTEYFPRRPIPQELYSVYLEGPFRTCIDCGKPLLTASQSYEIQKVYRGKQVIFEYALCVECGKLLLKEYSRQSKRAIQRFFLENFKGQEWPMCHFCLTPREQLREYLLTALCSGTQMTGPLITVCDKCMQQIDQLISPKTRDIQADFIKDKFPGVPAEFSPAPIMMP